MKHLSFGRIAGLSVAGVLAISLLTAAPAQAESIRITATRLTVRKGPAATQPKIGSAPKGRVYELLERKGPWLKIQFGAKGGWIHGKYTRPATGKAPAAEPGREAGGAAEGVQTVVPARLNARRTPGPKARIAFRLTRGMKVTVAETKGVWAKVTHRGRTGWVVAKYLTTEALPPPRRAAPRRRPARRPAKRPAKAPPR